MSNLPTKRKLTEKQENFLENVIETKGNLKLSAELAGYQGNHYQVIQSLKQELVDLASDVLAKEAPTAAFKLVDVLTTDKPIPQANVKVQAAQTILDRVGLGKKERLDVNHNVQGGIFILPEKETIDITDYQTVTDG
jgi:phage terminase small subunit|tara:strand:- start:223 stop:633 length:411 start_codon:yes stop_codon:yes gene_type:complete